MAAAKKRASRPKKTAGKRRPSKGTTRRRPAAGGKKSELANAVPWILLGLVAVGGAVYMLKPSTAQAATLPPPQSPRGTVASPPRPRSATTRSKPQMPAALRTLVATNQLAFWMLAALYTLDRGAGVPDETKVRRLAQGSGNMSDFDNAGQNALARLGLRGSATNLDIVTVLRDRLGSRRIELPYQVPSDVWAYVNVFLRDLFSTNSEAFEEPV